MRTVATMASGGYRSPTVYWWGVGISFSPKVKFRLISMIWIMSGCILVLQVLPSLWQELQPQQQN